MGKRATGLGSRLISACMALIFFVHLVPLPTVRATGFGTRDTGYTGLTDYPGHTGNTGSTYVAQAPVLDEGESGPNYVYGEVIVRMKETFGKMQVQGAAVEGAKTVDSAGPLKLMRLEEGRSLEDTLDDLKNNPAVEWAEPNYILRSQEDPEPYPNDPEYLLYHQWGLDRIQAPQAWAEGVSILQAASREATAVTVAVIDTGVDMSHADLFDQAMYDRIHTGDLSTVDLNLTTPELDLPYDNSWNGHGTHVAGIIAAKTDNGIGVAGVAGEFPVSILPIKVLDEAGLGTVFNVARAITLATDLGADIINLSLGARLPDFPRTLAEAVRYAQDNGVVVVAAAGNEGQGVQGFYPACLPGVLAAMAVDETGKMVTSSNWLDRGIRAPGQGIMSTLPTDLSTGEARYDRLSGTSQAAGFVSGTAALLRSILPELTAIEIADYIWQAQPIPHGLNYKVLSAWQAVLDAGDDSMTPAYLSPQFVSPLPTYPAPRLTGTVTFTVKVSYPDFLDRVEFALKDSADVQRAFEEVPKQDLSGGGFASVTWETPELADGRYMLWVTAFYKDGGSAVSIREIVLANSQSAGLTINVKRPDNSPAAGAMVLVLHAYPDQSAGSYVLEEVFLGPADLDGRVMIPNADATSGNTYLITAWGANPGFFYYELAKAPAVVTMGGTADLGIRTFTVSAKDVNGQPLAGASVYTEFLEGNLPDPQNPERALSFGWYGGQDLSRTCVGVIGADGTAEVTLSKGFYNVLVLCPDKGYYLWETNKAITESTAVMAFHPEPADVAVIQFEPDPRSTQGDEYLDLSAVNAPYFDDFELLRRGDSVTVTPGAYQAEGAMSFQEAGEEWRWRFNTPVYNVAGGETRVVRAGGSVTCALEVYKSQEPDGELVSFHRSYVDEYGNELRSYVASPPSLPVPNFQVWKESASEPFVDGDWGWTFETYDLFFNDEAYVGDYVARLSLDAGPLGPSDTGGIVVSPDAEFTVVGGWEDPGDPDVRGLTLTVKYGPADESAPVPEGTQIYLALPQEYMGGVYEVGYPVGWVDAEGKAFLPESLFNSIGDTTVTLLVVGQQLPVIDPVFAVVTLEVSEFPAEATIELGPVKRLDVTAYGVPVGENAVILTRAGFSIYGFDGEGIPVGLNLSLPYWDWDDDGRQSFLVPEGSYLIQARVRRPTQNDPRLYYLSKVVTVGTAELSAPGALPVDLDTTEASVIEVTAPTPREGAPDLKMPKAAVFRPDMLYGPVFDLTVPGMPQPLSPAPLYVTPGEYYLEGMLLTEHFDGLWGYWVVRDDPVEATPQHTPDELFIWQLGVPYDEVSISVDPNPCSPGRYAAAVPDITDGLGNRLRGMALHPDDTWQGQSLSSLCVSSRVPGAGDVLSRGGLEPFMQTHQNLAPSITVTGPDGGLEPVPAKSFYPTYFWVPATASHGVYNVYMEFDGGPDTFLKAENTFRVGPIAPVPQLSPPVSPTSATSVVLHGESIPGATVTVLYTFNDGTSTTEPQVADVVEVDSQGDGSFSLTVDLESSGGEGTYLFTAWAAFGGEESDECEAVELVVDWTAPSAPRDVTWESSVESEIELTWKGPADAVRFRVRRVGGPGAFEVDAVQSDEGTTGSYQDTGLVGSTDYTYEITSLDQAGNESEVVTVNARTSTLQDMEAPSAPGNVAVQHAPGGLAVVTWDASTDNVKVKEYRVYKTADLDGDGQWDAGPLQVDTVTDDGSQTFSWNDTGLLAETKYKYEIRAVDDAGNESVPSVAEGTTPALTIEACAWSSSLPVLSGNLLRPNTELRFSVTGEPNRQAEVRVTYQTWVGEGGEALDEPVVLETWVGLHASGTTPGLYEGVLALDSLTRPASTIQSVEGRVKDGAGHTSALVAASGTPVSVAATLSVDLAIPGGAYSGYVQIIAWNETAGAGMSAMANQAGSYELTPLVPGEYDVKVMIPGGRRVGTATVAVAGGEVKHVPIAIKRPSSLAIRVVEPDGNPEDVPVPGVTVVLENLTDSRPLGQFTTGEDGLVEVTGLLEDDQIRVTTLLKGEALRYPFASNDQVVYELEAGDKNVTMRLSHVPRGTVFGRAVDDLGEGLPGVLVSAAVTVELGGTWRAFTVSTTTDADGYYSFSVPAGKVLLGAASETGKYQLPSGSIVFDLGAGESREVGLAMGETGPATINLELTTTYLEGGPPQVKTNWTWNDLAHYDVEVTDSSGKTHDAMFHPIMIAARPFETVTVHLSGEEAGLPSESVQLQLDENRSGTARFHLIEKCRLEIALVNEDCSAYSRGPGQWLRVDVYKDEAGALAFVQAPWSFAGDKITVNPSNPGSYFVEVTELGSGGSSTGRRGTATISVAEGEIGTAQVVMSDRSPLIAGFVRATPQDTIPGTTLSLRAEFGLAPGTAGSAVEDAELYLDIPSGTDLVEDSVVCLVDGEALQPVGVDVDGNELSLDFGDLALSPGKKWVALYKVTVDEEFEGGALAFRGRVEYVVQGGDPATDYFQFVEVPVAEITINVPKNLVSLEASAWGRGPRGATVLVFDGDLLLGAAPVSPAGFWYLPIELPDLGRGAIHRLRSRADLPSGPVFSEEIACVYDPGQPELIQMELSQEGGSSVTIGTSGVVPRFPIVVSSNPLDFILTFTEPDRVSSVTLSSGTAKATGTRRSDGTFRVRLPFPWSSGVSDYGIYMTYETKKDPSDLSLTPPTLDQVRHMMPSMFKDFVIVDWGPLMSGQAGNTGGAYLEFLPMPDLPWLSCRVEMTVTKNVTNYTPSSEDIELAESTGEPVYGLTMSDSLTDHEWVIESECYMPQDLVSGPETGGQSIHSAAVGALVKIGTKVKYTATVPWKVFETQDSLSTALKAGDAFERLSLLSDYVARNCGGSPLAPYYQEMLDDLAWKALGVEGAKAGLIAVGAALAPETFGLGTLAVFGVSKGIEWAMDRKITKEIRMLAVEIMNDDDCRQDEEDEDDEDEDDRERIADPVPIWDPSGYVYEAVPENRLQGVTATAMEKDTGSGEWRVWDAEWFGQVNPQITNHEGKYGWDVPNGKWQVVYQKEGYEVATSDELTVPPPHFDVNVGLVSLASPLVTGVTPAQDGSYVDIAFSKYMLASTLTGSTITVSNRVGGATGDTAEGSVSAVDPVLVGGVQLASSARFTPDEKFEAGGEYEVWVNAVVQSYAGSPMAADVTLEFVVEETTDPGDDGDDDDDDDGGPSEVGDPGGPGVLAGLTYILGPRPGSIEALGGNVAMRHGQNVFSSGSSIRIAEVPGAITGLHGLIPVTPAYEFEFSGPKLSRRAEVLFKFDKTALGGINPLLLGVYRQDEHNPSRWVYVGGVVNVDEGTVTIWLSGFSRYAVMAKDVAFSDTATHWARESIQTLAARDLVNGVTETTFEPDRQITRAELAKMLVLMKMRNPTQDIAFEVPQIPTFADVGPGTWYCPYVETAAANGIVEGENGFFRPTDPVTRQELAAMVVRAMGLEEKADLLKDRKPEFDDAAEVSPWAYGYLGLALFKGLIRGVTDTTLEPLSSATRAQAAAVTLRAMERLGLVSTLKDIGGVLRVSDVEGRHFELDTLVDGSPVTYVLIPDGGMDGVIAKRLEGQVGKRIDVSGVLEDGVSMFMSGPVLRVLNVILPGCVLCEP